MFLPSPPLLQYDDIFSFVVINALTRKPPKWGRDVRVHIIAHPGQPGSVCVCMVVEEGESQYQRKIIEFMDVEVKYIVLANLAHSALARKYTHLSAS